jgi:hypothetical protein
MERSDPAETTGRAFTVIVIVDEVAGLPETQDSAEVSTT